jgi:hypothetical protein
MHRLINSLELVALSLLLSICASKTSSARAQQLPQIPPTIAAPEPLLPAPKAVPKLRHPAQVDYTPGSLKITANNSSLNQILGQISKATGLKIMGGVTDERVFGTYGPADIASVLTRLLDGFPINVLLRENGQRQPTELILTPRRANALPVAPSARVQAKPDTEDRPPQLAPHLDRPSEAFDGSDESGPEEAPAVSTLPPELGPPERGEPSPEPTTTQQSPNGVKTPQEIYEQLIQLQKQDAPTTPE